MSYTNVRHLNEYCVFKCPTVLSDCQTFEEDISTEMSDINVRHLFKKKIFYFIYLF